MNLEETCLFHLEDINIEEIRIKLQEIYEALKERGYNPTNQIVGYLISGDLGYISSYKDARKKMQSIERAKIVEILLKEFQNKQ